MTHILITILFTAAALTAPHGAKPTHSSSATSSTTRLPAPTYSEPPSKPATCASTPSPQPEATTQWP